MDNLEDRTNIYTLKNILRAEIAIGSDKLQIFDNTKYQLDLFKELIRLVNVSMSDFLDNINGLCIILPLVYSKEESQMLEKRLFDLLPYLRKGIEDDSSEYHKLKSIINKINSDCELLYNKLEIYQKECENLADTLFKYRSILYRINHGVVINKIQIELIRDLLNKKGLSTDKQILINEFINYHNIKVKYKEPRFSFTTIKMLQNNYELYDIDELFEKNKKDKLDECSNSIFDTIMENIQNNEIKEIIEEMTSWMKNDELDYVLKIVLNKFIFMLNSLKNNMLDENNYEDIEIRKLIIAEYNTYFYKFRVLNDYYLNKKTNEESEEVLLVEENDEDNKNNLFFAMTASKSYFERDIQSVPEEYYTRVKKLLEGFKKGDLPDINMKGFSPNSKLKGYRMLKEDQVRIVYRLIDNNNYLILGVFVKKDNRGSNEYIRIINRDYDYKINTEDLYFSKLTQSEEIYGSVIDYLEENSRKGNR